MKNIKNARIGVTLIELIISIAIIGIIIVSFLPLFTMSAKTNSRSEATLDSTYVGRDTMELIYSLIKKNKNEDFDDLLEYLDGKIKEDTKYRKLNEKEGNVFEYEYEGNKYIDVKFKEDGNLIGVVVRVYKDKDMNENKLEVQYESLYPWKGSGN